MKSVFGSVITLTLNEIFDGMFGYGKDIMQMENFIAFFELYLNHCEAFDNDFDRYLQFVDECLQAYHRRFTPPAEEREVPTLPDEDEEDGLVL